jgi:hypothetical protein
MWGAKSEGKSTANGIEVERSRAVMRGASSARDGEDETGVR